MRWKKILITTLTSLAVITPIAAIILPSMIARNIVGIDSYEMGFDPKPLDKNGNPLVEKEAINNSKNQYISDLKLKVKTILDEYQKEYELKHGQAFPGLELNFTTLNAAPSPGVLDFFSSLNKSMKQIDSRLSFDLSLRTPVSVNEGFYNRDVELISFYWSPDYNAVGTWLKYMFTDTYPIGNFWHPLQKALINTDALPWQKSLSAFLITNNIDPNINSQIDIITNYRTQTELDNFYVTLANLIGQWVFNNSSISKDVTSNLDIYGYGIELVNWIASRNPNIPYVEDGPTTITPILVRENNFNPINSNSAVNMRDWFKNNKATNTRFNYSSPNDPFFSKTPYNPNFNTSANSDFFQSSTINLTTWSTIGGGNNGILGDSVNQKYERDLKTELVSQGTKSSIENLVTEFNAGLAGTINNPNGPTTEMTFDIRPIPWVDSTGKIAQSENVNQYLSPIDFWAGFKAFQRSIDTRISSNGYFISLAGIDIEKTLSYEPNKLVNTSTSSLPFKIFFKKPTLSSIEILDILQKQYFSALPYFKQTVKNIVEDIEWEKQIAEKNIVLNEQGVLNWENSQNINVLYGVGFWENGGTQVWKDYVSAAPYYVESIDDQKITYGLNNEYLNSFNDDININPNNFTFKKEWTIGSETYSKFETIDLFYKVTTEIVTYERFNSGSLDTSKIPTANLGKTNASETYLLGSEKLNKSDLIPYNLQVYQKGFSEIINGIETGSQSVIIDSTGKPMWENNKPTYSLDNFGNYLFPEGKEPQLKSNITRPYYDLIVKDFHTPFENGGKSATIRKAINDLINWSSLKSLVFPGISKSIQYSFLPFGVYDTGSLAEASKYWSLVANKTNINTNTIFNSDIGSVEWLKRQTGNITWSYDELNEAYSYRVIK